MKLRRKQVGASFNHAADGSAYQIKCLDDRLPLYRGASWTKDYVERKLRLHVHVTLFDWWWLKDHPHEFCLSIEYPATAEAAHATTYPGWRNSLKAWRGDIYLVQLKQGDMDGTVLIHDREFVQHPKRMALRRTLPCVIRLDRLDVSYGCLIQPPQITPNTSVEVPLFNHDWELDPTPFSTAALNWNRLWRRMIQGGELPNQIVKCGAEALKYVSDEQGPVIRDWVGVNSNAIFSCLRVIVRDDVAWVALYEPLTLIFQGYEVLSSPLDLSSRFSQVLTHVE